MEKTFLAFGTINTITIQDELPEYFLDDAVNTALELDEKLSAFKKNSEVSLINENAGIRPVVVSEETLTILEEALKISNITEGAFDITIRPAVALWNIGKVELQGTGKYKRYVRNDGDNIPEEAELEDIQLLVDYRDININRSNNQVMLKKVGQGIDLGGIAKGYAADKVKRELVSKGVKHGLLNFGGNIMAIGHKIDGEDIKVGIQNPLGFRGEMIGYIKLNDLSVVTSGVNERFFIKDGYRYHHIMDPKTLSPVESSLLSVSLIGECSMELDALTTALFVLGFEKGATLVKKLGLEALFVLTDNRVFGTAAFVDMKI